MDLTAVLRALGLSAEAIAACTAAADAAPPLSPDQSGRLRLLFRPTAAELHTGQIC